MFAPLVGPVTTRPDARLHLNVFGRAHCGAGTGRVITSRHLELADKPRVCRRCLRRLSALLLDGIREAMSRYGATAARCLATLNRLYDALRPAAQVRAETTLAARVAATMAGPIRPLSGFGTIAAGHQAAIAADRAARTTGQLALFAA